jgi:hypothetical protein
MRDPPKVGCCGSMLTAILDERRLRRVLSTMLDEDEFLGPHGIPARRAFGSICCDRANTPSHSLHARETRRQPGQRCTPSTIHTQESTS